MSEICKVTVEQNGDLAILQTDGYINNQGGEEIARESYALMNRGIRKILIDLSRTKIVNSIGISILIEILEKMMENQGSLAFCGLTPTIDKTFRIMGLAQFAKIFPTREEGTRTLRPPP
jgi:anti-anti-sigma factor